MSSPQTSVAPELLQDSLNSPTVDEDPEEHKKRRGHAEIQLTDQTNLLSTKKIVLTFFGLSFCVFVSTLDSVIVTAALSTIGRYFNAGAVVSWVPSAYLLTSTSFLPLYGRFSDILGRKTTLNAAMAIYMIGSLAAGLSRNIVQLIVFRAIAGVGGGGLITLAQIIMSDIVTLRDRGKYQGLIGVAIAISYAVGPVIGGALAEKVSWRWCFWVPLPIALISILVTILVLPLKPVEGNMREKLMAIDYFGTLLSITGCVLLILPLIWGGVTFPWDSAEILAPLFCGLLVVVLFTLWEWKGARLPIVPMYIFKHVTVSGVYITMFANGFIFLSSIFYLPQFFQVVFGYSPIRSAVFLLPVLVTQTTACFLAGLVVSKTGRYRAIVYFGFTVLSISQGLTSTVTQPYSKTALVIYMLLSGTGSGLTLQTTTVAVQASVERKDMSVVTAVRNLVRLFGGTLSLAVGSALINNSLRRSLVSLGLSESTIDTIIADPTILQNQYSLSLSPDHVQFILSNGYTRGFRNVFILNAAMAAMATIVSITMIHHKELIREDDARLKEEAKRRELERKVHTQKDWEV